MANLPSSLVKEFAMLANRENTNNTPQYLKGTAKTSGDKKYVQIDGSSQLTPIAETVDVQDGDRVLVSIDNHVATILGNFTFPPSARKEEEALDKADEAVEGSNAAIQSANEAKDSAATAMQNASTASSQAAEAIQKAGEAQTAADMAKGLAETAQTAASAAGTKADEAISKAQESFEATSDVRNQVESLNGAVTEVQGDISDALAELTTQANEISGIQTSLTTNYATKTELGTVETSLTQTISTSLAELSSTIEQTYAAKTDVVAIEGSLQSQITQNANGLNSQATKIEKIETDTAAAQVAVEEAKSTANAAQQAADQAAQNAQTAISNAEAAQEYAEQAQTNADLANVAAIEAKADARVADEALAAARTALNEAKENYKNVIEDPESTAEQIAQAEQAVIQAGEAVNQALADAATASYAAEKAQEAADAAAEEADIAKTNAEAAKTTAENAQQIANTASEKAMQAQEDVAALTLRVTTAETNISQNAEQISLTASKTEEIGTLLENDYYKKTETDAAIEVAAEQITQQVSSTIQTTVEEEVGKISIGARNLFLNSKFSTNFDKWVPTETVTDIYTEITTNISSAHIGTNTTASVYQDIIQRISVEDIKRIYTISGDVKLDNYVAGTDTHAEFYFEGNATTKAAITVDTISGSSDFLQYAGQGWMETRWTVLLSAIPDSTIDADNLVAGIRTSNFTGDLYFKDLKLEKGTNATDWTPAPEDQESYTDSAIQTNTTTITEQYTSLIDQVSEQLRLLVQEVSNTVDGLESATTSLSNEIQITSEMTSFIQTTVETLENVVNGKVDQTTIQEWARFDGASLELGASNSPFKAILSNTELGFWQGDSKVAWISNNELNILTAIIAKSIGCGNYTFVDEGELGLSLI